MIINELEGYPVCFTEKVPLKDFRYPVFYNKKKDINYYVIEKPTTIMKSKVEYHFKKDIEEPEDHTEYFSLAEDMAEKLLETYHEDGYRPLFILLKGPLLKYVKGTILRHETYKKNKMYLGKYVSNRAYNFKSLMFNTNDMTLIKEEK